MGEKKKGNIDKEKTEPKKLKPHTNLHSFIV